MIRSTMVAALVALGVCQGALAHEFEYEAVLTGASVVPPNGSPALGFVHLTTDLDLVNVRIEVSFAGLTAPVTSAAIHGKTAVPGTGDAIVAIVDPTLPSFPLGVTSGSYDQTINLGLPGSYSPAFITASGGTTSDALNAFLFGLDEGRMYFQINTTNFPGGEVRGYLALVPEPGSLVMLGLGAGVLLGRRRAETRKL